MPLGSGYDPDVENFMGTRPAWSKPHTPLEQDALEACGRKYFKEKLEAKRFRDITLRAMGSTPSAILYGEWVEHNIKIARDENASSGVIAPVRTIPWLIASISNDDRRVKWEAANREEIFKLRAASVNSKFFVHITERDEEKD
jgi:hypothetical protein